MSISRMLRGWLCVCGLFVAAGTCAADDAYLKALEAEAQSVAGSAADKSTPVEQRSAAQVKKGWALSDQIIGGELPPQLSQPDFEATLENSFYGTFMFYSKLNVADKVNVYQEYQRNGTIENIRNKVMSLLKK